MSTSPSPDIDRLSMERRLRRLEAGIGSGGSGGFGLSFPDFDQFPDNEVSKTPNGLVLKYSIDNLGSIGVTELNNVGFKFIAYAQFIQNSGGVFFFAMARMHISRQMGYIRADRTGITFDPNIANRKLWDDVMAYNGDRIQYLQIGQFTFQINGFGSPNGQGNAAPVGSLHFVMYSKSKWTLNVGRVVGQPALPTIYPCYTFGCSNITLVSAAAHSAIIGLGSSSGDWAIRPGIMLAQLQDMPVQFQDCYPRSWWS